ncbi:hypothetical protein CLAFUW4_08332 [Fulvia fulva]|uniref:Uncharacterized protein n=1 Tax=Passalora fulva TaxID=5499 RepID=A0A9Q8LCZ3_PASFU|nr:uncharacterized protein CLAFUR5_08440 [Fulvia fulva]KAK4629609.1 hypothetical protein CLAFUR4_08337 [Fulvia fulva]KAK4630222.1 hypothetical protein CLAFUR0_08332 [Fulvia fulva]UJO15261.1 hypothetical protein CLAFUR5_08440 [Fulvia fulva]WPV12611.1 hypothetical protein CLAFUW4_08332 [Fulvia fulva]WPV27852.1 hypothetical protein CLAFUW7_08332 [Fulvia fulva]
MSHVLTLPQNEPPTTPPHDAGESAQTKAATHLEHLARSFTAAINARDFNPESVGWSFLSTILNVVMAHPPAGHDKPISRDVFRQRLQHYAESSPTFHERVIDVTAQVDRYCMTGGC